MKKDSSFCTFYIVRHGLTDWNVNRLLQGQTNNSLNKQGEEQARERAEKLRHIHFDAVFSSDLLRAQQTAEILLLERKIAIQTTKALRERSFGNMEGKSWLIHEREIKDMYDRLATLTHEQLKRFNYGAVEKNEDVIARFIPFVRELAVGYRGKTVLLVSHGGLMRMFLIHVGFGKEETLRPGCCKNTSYVKFTCDGVEFEIKETEGVEKG